MIEICWLVCVDCLSAFFWLLNCLIVLKCVGFFLFPVLKFVGLIISCVKICWFVYWLCLNLLACLLPVIKFDGLFTGCA